MYRALVRRDASHDGKMYYAVRTTGVYCRPSCSSRTPLEKNVEFFQSAAAAKLDGYRACKRCKPDESSQLVDPRLLAVCRRIERAESAPSLQQLADAAGLSPFHLQRRFKATIGVSPRQYADMVKRTRLRSKLKQTNSVTSAIYDAGFASASQAYDPARAGLGMTPSNFRAGGKNARIVFAVTGTSFGNVLVAATARGICRVDIGEDAACARVQIALGISSRVDRARRRYA